MLLPNSLCILLPELVETRSGRGGRLRRLSTVVRESMGDENAKLYTGVAAILIESAAPYSIAGLIFLIPYARGNLVSVALGQVWAKCTVRHLT